MPELCSSGSKAKQIIKSTVALPQVEARTVLLCNFWPISLLIQRSRGHHHGGNQDAGTGGKDEEQKRAGVNSQRGAYAGMVAGHWRHVQHVCNNDWAGWRPLPGRRSLLDGEVSGCWTGTTATIGPGSWQRENQVGL